MANVTTSHGELLHLVRAREGLSRQQLMAETGMSRGTLYSRLDVLIRLGPVYEAESLGRPAAAGHGGSGSRIAVASCSPSTSARPTPGWR
jgi:hypothetical protein